MSVRKTCSPAKRATHDNGEEMERFRATSRRRSNSTGKKVRRVRSNSTRVKKSNAVKYGVNRREESGGRREQPRASGPFRERVRTWSGCDSRGDSWHTNKELFDCFKKPCNAEFCQRCAKHGHTAEHCKVPESTEGLNTSGYFQEQRPGKSGPKRPPASRVNSSSGKRCQDRHIDSDGSDSEDDDSHASGSGRGRGNTARRSNSSRGHKGRGRL